MRLHGPEACLFPLVFFDHSLWRMVKGNRIWSQRKQITVCTLSIPDRLFIFQFICASFFLHGVLSQSQPSSVYTWHLVIFQFKALTQAFLSSKTRSAILIVYAYMMLLISFYQLLWFEILYLCEYQYLIH